MTHTWDRHWRCVDERLPITDGAFVMEPRVDGVRWNEHLQPLSMLRELPTLILLGGMGTGKSHALRAAVEEEQLRQHGTADRAVLIDLKTRTSDVGLRSAFSDDQVLQAALPFGNGTVHLFIDSLDECLRSQPRAIEIIVECISAWTPSRLRLRVACRSTNWTTEGANALAAWRRTVTPATNGVQRSAPLLSTYELVPLFRRHVVNAALDYGIEPESFLRDVSILGAEALAANPQCLAFLLSRAVTKLPLSSSRVELFEEACLQRCKEGGAGNLVGGALPPSRRLATAKRIAAAMYFSNRTVISLREEGSGPGRISPSELSDGRERAGLATFDVTQECINEVLNTGLFAPCGTNELMFDHAGTLEYLAARYLRDRDLPPDQVATLFYAPHASVVVPQMRPVAAWYAAMDRRFVDRLVVNEPATLLLGDVHSLAPSLREQLVASLLSMAAQGRYQGHARSLYRALNHDTLASQLRSAICDRSAHQWKRLVALDIATECAPQGIQEALTRVALDNNDDYDVRVRATHALSKTGTSDARRALKSLICAPIPSDKNDELLGYVLTALWPDAITVNEMFDTITPPKCETHIGGYAMFLGQHFAAGLRPSDIPVALRWVHVQGERIALPDAYASLIDAIFHAAWVHVLERDIAHSFAEAYLARAKRDGVTIFDEYYFSTIKNDTARRHSLLSALLDVAVTNEDVHEIFKLVIDVDVEWLLSALDIAPNSTVESTIIKVLQLRLSHSSNFSDTDTILASANKHSLLANALSPLTQAIPIDSDVAKTAREQEIEIENYRKKYAPKRLEPSPSDRVEKALRNAESGDVRAFCQLTRELTLEETSRFYGSDSQLDVQTFPGWRVADTSTRDRILQAARAFVLNGDPANETWMHGYPKLSALAGLRALLLLVSLDRPFISTLGAASWAKWAAVIVSQRSERTERKTLLRLVDEAVPAQVESVLFQRIAFDDVAHQTLLVGDELEFLWTDTIGAQAIHLAQRTTLSPRSRGMLLSLALLHRSVGALATARRLVSGASAHEPTWPLIVEVASALFRSDDADAWSELNRILTTNPRCAMQVVQALAERTHPTDPLSSVPESRLASMFCWLESRTREFDVDANLERSTTKRRERTALSVDASFSMRMFKDTILHSLGTRGTTSALTEIERIQMRFTRLDLNYILTAARERHDNSSWTPIEPAFFLTMIERAERRVVNTSDELQSLVEQSLGRLQKRLFGHTPEVRFLWDRQHRTNTYIPLDENEVSDYVKRHLSDDLVARGVVVNREVQISASYGPDTGARTDIHVDAVARSGDEKGQRLTTVVEVKGSWNSELFEAMDTQLRAKYLRTDVNVNGIFLVVWFRSEMWGTADSRRRKWLTLDIASCRSTLEEQAIEISRNGNTIRVFVLDATFPPGAQGTANRNRLQRHRPPRSASLRAAAKTTPEVAPKRRMKKK